MILADGAVIDDEHARIKRRQVEKFWLSGQLVVSKNRGSAEDRRNARRLPSAVTLGLFNGIWPRARDNRHTAGTAKGRIKANTMKTKEIMADEPVSRILCLRTGRS